MVIRLPLVVRHIHLDVANLKKMKNNYFNNGLRDTLKLIVLLFLLFGGCSISDVKKEKNEETILKTEKYQVPVPKENINGTDYSDSMIKVLSKLSESIELDSFVDLHSFDKAKFQFEHCNEFTVKMLAELDIYGLLYGMSKTIKYPKVTKHQNELLGVTEYLCDKTFRDDFATYIFHSSGVESHYSNSIQLFTISNKTNKYNSLVLSQQYMSEGYEYDLTSRFTSINELEVKVEERFNTSNISPIDDSTSYTKTDYFISEEGDIKLKE